MISAADAAQNVLNFEIARYQKVEETVNLFLEEVGKSIEFHSQNGFSYLEFMPYNHSRFQSDYEIKTASQIFEKVLTKYGYTIAKNDTSQNVLKIVW